MTQAAGIIQARISVSGVVQGVGFRPFVYRLAREQGLTGFVANTMAGVTIEVTGHEAAVDSFVEGIERQKPPLSVIAALDVQKKNGFQTELSGDFVIRESIASGAKVGPVAPDSDVCPSCLVELFDPANRRFGYPFINCTDCGPRFTLIKKTPYDRPSTSMADFPLCPDCEAEYHDPADRRFHAQANCCPACGPGYRLLDNHGREVATGASIVHGDIATVADLLRCGKIVAIKGVGGFHLVVSAIDATAVARLRQRKGRPEKPLAVMAADLETARSFAEVDGKATELLASSRKPVVLLRKGQHFPLADNVAPDNNHVGVMLPYTPMHHLLLSMCGLPALVMTSGNLSGEPIVTGNDEVFAKLGKIADYIYLHNRQIISANDDSVIRPDSLGPSIIRRARAFVPAAVKLAAGAGRTLALGAIKKNTICVTRDNEAFVSQHIGDLDNLATAAQLEKIIDHFTSLLLLEPDLVVHDLHPDYPGSRYASSQQDLPIIGVQHHHAHIVSCMAEHKLAGPVIGLAMDGSGYGPDSTVWGGEVLVAAADCFERAAHLSRVGLPGNEAAVRQPWRMAISHLYKAFGPACFDLDLEVLTKNSEALPTVARLLESGFNTPLTSSCGRLFDAVAALLGIRYSVSYEGQAAAELEMLAQDSAPTSFCYPFTVIREEGHPWQIETEAIIRAVVRDLHEGVGLPVISNRFHDTLAALLVEVSLLLREKHQIDQVVLSGGVFQNMTLRRRVVEGLRQQGFAVFAHSEVPTNDGGLSLGQAVAGRAIYERRKKNGPEAGQAPVHAFEPSPPGRLI